MWIDVEPRTFDRKCLEVSKLMIRLLRHDDTVHREEDGAVRFEVLASLFRSRNASTSHCSIRTWLSFLQRGSGVKKRFQYRVNPNSTEHFLYLRAIQGHSGGVHVDPTLQDNVLLPDDFAEHIFHVGNSHDLHSFIQSGPGSNSLKKERHAVFVSRQPNLRRSAQRSRVPLDESHNCSVQKSLENTPTCSMLVYFEGCSEEGIAVLSDTIQRNRLLQHLTCDLHREELHNKVYQSPKLPRKAVLKPNLHHKRKDLFDLEAVTSVDHQSKESEDYGEIRSAESRRLEAVTTTSK